jgi:hypothetical protein
VALAGTKTSASIDLRVIGALKPPSPQRGFLSMNPAVFNIFYTGMFFLSEITIYCYITVWVSTWHVLKAESV